MNASSKAAVAEQIPVNGHFVTSITSQGQPQSGQSHRSSANFSTAHAGGSGKFLWVITNTDDPDRIRFKVMKDISFGIDETVYTDVSNNKTTNIVTDDALYIADPEGTFNNSFTVSIYVVDENS